jgi:chemotaxis protein CheX
MTVMTVAYINAFICSTENVFATILQTNVTVGTPRIKTAGEPHYDVSGIIGLSGDVVGVTVLSFPTEVAQCITSQFTGMPLTLEDEDFADAIGELVNMVSGNAKLMFEGKNATISCPSVVIGKGHSIFQRRDVSSVEIPCNCEWGDFMLEVALKDLVIPSNGAESPKAEVATQRGESS